MVWLIVKTDFRKEQYVASQIGKQGYDVWHPVQIIACRPAASRRVTAKAQLRAFREIAILPRRVFVRMDYIDRDTYIDAPRHVLGFEMGPEGNALRIPDQQIAAFRAVIDAENTAALALSQKASRRQKAKWRDLKEALVELIDGAKAQLEQAA